MIVYVKESSAINVSKVEMQFKSAVEIRSLRSISDVTDSDIIMISNRDDNLADDLSKYRVIEYEKIYDKIEANISRELRYNHDYYYLKTALTYVAKPNITTLISGSSYGVFGIDISMLENAVNLASISQDLYYSTRLIYSACKVNKNIKNIVLCVGYYYFHSDLSKTQNEDELLRISKVYKPLLNDTHNCVLVPPKQNILYESDLFDIHGILEEQAKDEYRKGFFHCDRPRKVYATKEWEDKTKNWNDLSIDEKKQAARKRAENHNRSIKRESSLAENILHFQKLLCFCQDRNINLWVVVTPGTSYYIDYLLPDFKAVFYEVINSTDGMVRLLDLANETSFKDEDFNDTDHLNDNGARKLTAYIGELLEESAHESVRVSEI